LSGQDPTDERNVERKLSRSKDLLTAWWTSSKESGQNQRKIIQPEVALLFLK